jgi:hypothetical protein
MFENIKTREEFEKVAGELIEQAKKEGKVLEIYTEPTKPLRMGGYRMLSSVREARVLS